LYPTFSLTVSSTIAFLFLYFVETLNHNYSTVAIAILSGYGGLIVLYKITSAMSSKKEAPAPAAAAPVATGDADAGVPAVDSPAFVKYVESDAFYKLLEDEVQLGKLVESM
jgi:hypothetical protein